MTTAGVRDGAWGEWSTTAPAGVLITAAQALGDYATGVGAGDGFTGAFSWDGGRRLLTDSFDHTGLGLSGLRSRRFDWYVRCSRAGGCTRHVLVSVGELRLTAIETARPTVTPGGAMWTASGWVRGTWPVALAATDPSGVCAVSLTGGNSVLQGPMRLPNTGRWQQCPNALWSTPVDTSTLPASNGQGAGHLSLQLTATDAAGNATTVQRQIAIDNVTPAVSLTGPYAAPASAGPQFITATASAGPSGVAGISCTVDAQSGRWLPGKIARIAVTGIGAHTVFCFARSNAVDASGQAAVSPVASFTVRIRSTSASSLWFPGAHSPHATSATVPFGQAVTVAGRLTTSPATSLTGAKVTILGAPVSDPLAVRPLATAAVTPDGTWTARIPAGPSRVLTADYGGAPLITPSQSNAITETVPAKISLSINTHRIHWGATVHLTGRLFGGFVPSAGEFVDLRIGRRGAGWIHLTQAYTDQFGRFSVPYAFPGGNGTETYTIWAVSAREADYPYAPGTSNSVALTVVP